MLHKRSIIDAFLLTCLAWLVSSCNIVSPVISEPTLTPSPSLTATTTSVPSSTPTPTPQPPMAVLLSPSGADETFVNSLQTSLNDIVIGQGLRWQVRQSLSVSELIPALRLVVVVSPDPGLAGLASNAPETQFLALGIPG